MSLDDLSPTSLSGGTTQDDFNQTSGVSQQMPQPQPLPDLTPDIAELAADFKRILPMMGPAAMRAFHRQIGGFIDELQGMQNDIQHALLPYNLAQTREWLGLLPHALGEQFMQSADRANIAISVNPKKSGEGAYASYNHEYGFVNGVEFNTTATNAGADNDSVFFGTYIHEILHGASTRVAPALYFTPWNKATNVVMHPLAWMRVENISERMSYAASALGYYFLSLAKPEMKDHLLNLTEKYVVSLADVIEISKRTSSLQELVTETTLTALDKRLIRGNTFGRTEADRNYDNAIVGYWNGLVPRVGKGEKFVYLRPEPEDFYALGNIGTDINFLGSGNLDPRFLNWPALREQEQENLDGLCNFEKNNIPPLENCLTISEYLDQNPDIKAKFQTAPQKQSSAFAPIGGNADIVHAPMVN